MDLPLQIELLKRQYLQILDPEDLLLPRAELLKLPEIQTKIYEVMFNETNIAYPLPARYAFRVLKRLVHAIEQAIDDPEEDVGFPHYFTWCSSYACPFSLPDIDYPKRCC